MYGRDTPPSYTPKADKKEGRLIANIKNSPKAQAHLKEEDRLNIEQSEQGQSRFIDLFLRRYTELPSYRVRPMKDGKFKLIPNHKKINSTEELPEEDPQDGKHIFIILYNKDTQQLELKITKDLGTHYGLAKKAERIVAAGEIYFYQGKIILINDQSGTYNWGNLSRPTVFEHISKINKFTSEFKQALHDVGLPNDCVRFYYEYKSDCSPDYDVAIADFLRREKMTNYHCRLFAGVFGAVNLAVTGVAIAYKVSTL